MRPGCTVCEQHGRGAGQASEPLSLLEGSVEELQSWQGDTVYAHDDGGSWDMPGCSLSSWEDCGVGNTQEAAGCGYKTESQLAPRSLGDRGHSTQL